MRKTKENSGITLIALIVTIIVLLILAAVSVKLIGGSEGILGKASNATDKYKIARKQEKNTLDEYEKAILSKYSENVDSNSDEKKIENSRGNVSELINDFSIEISNIRGRSMTIKANSQGTTDNSNIIGYIYFLNGKGIGVSESNEYIIENLAYATNYNNIYVMAIDENGNLKKSNNILNDIMTLSVNIEPLDYPIITQKGVVNCKYINPENSNDWEYNLNLSVDCTASNAMNKAAYDGDETTCCPANQVIRFASDADFWSICWKYPGTHSGWHWKDCESPVYCGYDEASLLESGYWHNTWVGRGYFDEGLYKFYNKIYEIKYDSSL